MFLPRPLQVIVRDDDVSALTSADGLWELYGPAWERRQPVCLFVVPLGSPQIVEARPAPGPMTAVPLAENVDLCDSINRAILEGQVEIGLHGLHHSLGEFDIPDSAAVLELLDESKAIIESALPRARLRTFVPPRESMSASARDTVLEQGFNICAASTALWSPSRWGWWLRRLSRKSGWPGFHRPISLDDTRWLFPCDEYLFTAARHPEQCLKRARWMAVWCAFAGWPLICVNHHWELLGAGQSGLRRAWWTFLVDLLEMDNVQFTTFNTYQPGHSRAN